TPVDTESKLGADGTPVSNPTLYKILVGALHYLTFTRHDLSYAVLHVFLYTNDPREPYLAALKRILRYVCGTLDYFLQLYSSSTSSLAAYSNADWEGCPTTRRFSLELQPPLHSTTIVYCDNVSVIYLSSNLVQHQRTKHIEIDIDFVGGQVATRLIRVLHVPSRYQYADIFTKGLPSALFDEFQTSLSIMRPPAPTWAEADLR
nr:ribonuclease H-like domain-containing protein [Tanacetum cinerariifolium]